MHLFLEERKLKMQKNIEGMLSIKIIIKDVPTMKIIHRGKVLAIN